MMKVSSTNCSHVWGRADDLHFKLFNEQVSNKGTKGGTHGSTMDLLIILTLEEEGCVFKAKLQK